MGKSSVIALQENLMGEDWTAAMLALCAGRGYTYIPTFYGHRGNGYMGVGLAVPNATFEILAVDLARIADLKVVPPPPTSAAEQAPTVFNTFSGLLLAPFRFLTAFAKFLYFNALPSWLVASPSPKRGAKAPLNADQVWKEALNRHNRMVSVRLKDRASGGIVCVSNYHMPCVYWSPPIMMIHAALAAQHALVRVTRDVSLFSEPFCLKSCVL